MEPGFDIATFSEAFSVPGNDPRQWVSFGVVSPAESGSGADQSIIDFDPDHGPLVSVKLQPSGIPVSCRVLSSCAGNGEGDWTPFVKGDEVMVVVPEGDERAGCTIIGRLNNRFARFPTSVAGQDVTANNFSWRRRRTGHVEEVSGPLIIRNATTGAFFGFDKTGQINMGNGDKAGLFIRSDIIGFQNADADVLMQIDVGKKQVVLEAAGSKFILDANQTIFITGGSFSIGTNGNTPVWHVATIEGTINLLINFFIGLGAALPVPIPISTIISAIAIPGINACADQTLGVLSPAVTAALAATFTKSTTPPYAVPDPTGLWQTLHPGLGVSTFLTG